MAPLAAGETPAFLGEVAALVVAGAVVAYLGFRLRIVPIVAFLLAGVLIGPYALGVVENRDLVDAAAEVGVILLLFTIGLEFSLDRLARIRRLVFVGGCAQLVLSAGVTTLILLAAGVDWRAAVFTGLLVALSSTAIVLKLLGERAELHLPHGHLTVAILLFQDLAAVVMVLAIPVLAGTGPSGAELPVELLKAAGIVTAVIVVARRVVPAVLEAVARTCSPEIFLLTVMAICFGTAYGTSLAGVSVSLGAFLAGLVVAESRYDQQALGEILPLQIVFSAVFFVSVGMLLDVGFVVDHLPAVIGAVVAIFVVKAVTAGAAARLVGFGLPLGAASGLMLAQIGEFSFVLERAGRDVGLSFAGEGAAGAQTFIAATVLLMVATPPLSGVGSELVRRMRPAGPEHAPAGLEPLPESRVAADLEDHVIVAGYAHWARMLTAVLQRSGVPLVVVTLSPDGAAEAHERGLPVLLGDPAKTLTLREAGIARARHVVVPDDEPAMAARVASVARVIAPDVRITVRTRYAEDAPVLREAGADEVVVEVIEAAVALTLELMRDYDVPADRMEEEVAILRSATSVSAVMGAGAPTSARGPGGRTVVDTDHVVVPDLDPEGCPHVAQVRPVVPSAPGCEDCLRIGSAWVHLRLCMTCGHVGCCDSSPHRHARAHHEHTGHPIVRSAEPGEDWGWCYVDERELASTRRDDAATALEQ